jgi:hypothetical protein
MPIQTELGPVFIDLAEPAIRLARTLGRAENQEVAAAALREADSTLDTWEASLRKAGSEPGKTTLPFGVEVACLATLNRANRVLATSEHRTTRGSGPTHYYRFAVRLALDVRGSGELSPIRKLPRGLRTGRSPGSTTGKSGMATTPDLPSIG